MAKGTEKKGAALLKKQVKGGKKMKDGGAKMGITKKSGLMKKTSK